MRNAAKVRKLAEDISGLASYSAKELDAVLLDVDGNRVPASRRVLLLNEKHRGTLTEALELLADWLEGQL